jgi:endonuclease/exonuclease/phosphatase family metal-dependent hydrolase
MNQESDEIQTNESNSELTRPSWVQRHRVVCLITLLFLLFLAPYVWSRATSETRLVQVFSEQAGLKTAADASKKFSGNSGQSRTPNELTVFVMNIAHGRGQAGSNWDEWGVPKKERVAKIAALIKQHGPDFVVLNECDFNSTWSGHQNQAAAIAQAAGFPYRMEQRNLDFRFLYGGFSFGNAVLSKFPIANVKYVEYPAVVGREWEQTACGKKGGAVATIQIGPAKFLQLFAIHIEHRDEDIRHQSIKNVLSQTTDVPTLLAGDFNSTPSDFPGHVKSSDGQNTIDTLLAAGNFETRPASKPKSSDLTFPSDAPTKVIDWVFASEHLRIVEYQVIQSNLSDHLPLLVKLQLKDESDQAAEQQ